MNHYPCDQFAVDILAVQDALKSESGISVSINIHDIEKIMDDIENIAPTDMADAVETALWSIETKNEMEYEAIKRIVEKIFKRRLGYRQQMHTAHGRRAPFAPR